MEDEDENNDDDEEEEEKEKEEEEEETKEEEETSIRYTHLGQCQVTSGKCDTSGRDATQPNRPTARTPFRR